MDTGPGRLMAAVNIVNCVLLCMLAGQAAAHHHKAAPAAAHQQKVAPPPLPPAVGVTCETNYNFTENDRVIIQGALNLEYLEAEYFLWAAYGYGLDELYPGMSEGGPPPMGVRKANLGPYYDDLFMQLGQQEVGHLRIIKGSIGAEYDIPRPLMNLSTEMFGRAMNMAVGQELNPPFDPFANSLNYLLSAFSIPHVGLATYVGASENIIGSSAVLLLSKILAVESAQDAIIRNELYRRKDEKVEPYDYTTAEFTTFIANMSNSLAGQIVNEGIVVPEAQGAEGKITGNVVAADGDSASFASNPREFLAILYMTGDAALPGGYYPDGCLGVTAEGFLNGQN
ncbi:hypothetical protein M758_9G077900 [Ceratodon purpureus]|nr:hypothetical protein M758_9G077900 [Ceratodon purpureus]